MNLKLGLVFTALVMAAISSANLIVNGSFETPNTGTGWGIYANDKVGGWFAEQNSMEVGAATVYGVTGQTGKQVLEMDATGNAKVSQNVNTLKTSYTITLDAAMRKNIAASSCTLSILWNDVVIANIAPTSTAMASFSYTVQGTGKMDKLSLLGTGKSDSYGGLVDNVQLNPSAAPVPEPASFAVIGVGIAGFLRRRRK